MPPPEATLSHVLPLHLTVTFLLNCFHFGNSCFLLQLSKSRPPFNGFKAYFEPDNHLDVFNYSTSSTNAVCYILIR